MFLDAATLQDLAIVPMPGRVGPTVWSLVDRTRTRIGRQTLREQLLAPPHSVEAIRSLQRAHQMLAADSDAYRIIIDRAGPDRVEQYLGSTWQLPVRMPALTRFRRWHRQYRHDVEAGQASVSALLEAASDLRSRLSGSDAVILAALGQKIASVIDLPETRELQALASRSSATGTFDQLARDTGRPLIESLVRYLGRVEALWSLGTATREHGWCYPELSSRFRATGLVHPLLGLDAVPNDLYLDELVRVCFVTGPNMAGKSTFLKAVAVAVLLAHAGCGVPATSMEFRPVGAVFSSVDIVDNLSGGESFYLAEVRRIATLAETLSRCGSAVAVIDEPFRGTNVHDAAEATLAVIARLAAHPAVLALVASHVGEVVPGILNDPRIALLQFSADDSADQPRFDYRLRDGVSTQRLGMTLLRQERVLDLLEDSAKAASVTADGGSEPTMQTRDAAYP